MKRLCSLLIAAMLILSMVAAPAFAVTFTDNVGAAPHIDAEAENPPSAGGIKLVETDESCPVIRSMDLNEALNVPGGELTFSTSDLWEMGLYPWVVEEDYAKSSNQGIDPDPNSQCQVSTTIDFAENQGISFRFRVSCEATDNTDWFAAFADGAVLGYWYGEVDWNSVSFAIPAGEHEITWCYNKNEGINEGEDTAWLDDVEVISVTSYELVHSEQLDNALNVTGGELEFYTVKEAVNGYYPWIDDGGYAVSTNTGIDSEGAFPSVSVVTATVNVEEGEILRFRYSVSSEKDFDFLRFYVDGERLERWSGEVDWQFYQCAIEPGVHELKWEYTKNGSGSRFEDTAYLDDIYIGEPTPVSGVEIQSEAQVPAYRRTQLTWNVLPADAFNRSVCFSSADESIATVDQNGVVTGITEGVTTITVTTVEGGFTADCTVTVTTAVPPVELYGFMYARMEDDDEGWFSQPSTWVSFLDTNPTEVNELGQIYDGDYLLDVASATQVGDYVYGYTTDGYYFRMDLEALMWGEAALDYIVECNITGDWSFYPNEIAYDYSTGKMYIINYNVYAEDYYSEVWEIDMETGDVLDGTRHGILANGEGEIVYGFAIDLDGTAYIMFAGFGGAWGGNGCSRLATLDLSTGEASIIGQTTAHCYQEQSMCFDHNTGVLYWAQFATTYNLEPMELYIVDTETAEIESCGRITQYGANITGLFVPYFGGEEPITPEPVTPEPITPEPVTPEPITPEPITDEPITDEPITDEPITDEPITDEPITDEPITDEPITDEPITDEPITDEPVEPPVTGGFALAGIGIAAILSGAGITLFRRK